MEKYLLDTHILIWYFQGSDELSEPAKQCISGGQCFYSLASLWEIAIKQTLKKLDFDCDMPYLAEESRKAGFVQLPVTPIHIEAIKQLPLIHRDPFDRLLVAQAQCENLTIITHDRYIKQYSVRTLF